MELNWTPIVHSETALEIPRTYLPYDAATLKHWTAVWQKSGRSDYRAWGEYQRLANITRFNLPFQNQGLERRFAELFTALSLHRAGFESWGGVQLFNDKKVVKRGKGRVVINTEEVCAAATWRWPGEVQPSLDFQPRNPDVVALSIDKQEWRFCETKRSREAINPEQLQGLAVLHLLTRAPVAIVELSKIPRPTDYLPVALQFKSGESVEWIERSLLQRRRVRERKKGT